MVAIDKDTPEPSDAAAYVENLKVSVILFRPVTLRYQKDFTKSCLFQSSLQWLSTNLWQSTERFHLTSVDIMVPDTWDLASDVPEADIT